jgi:hypothetical protein
MAEALQGAAPLEALHQAQQEAESRRASQFNLARRKRYAAR